ncbi:MAG TPA: ABC transporter permease subunit [Gemmataceae bacterium]|nr:ABC transporter permease subunit [Gemmataceae bacterium]
MTRWRLTVALVLLLLVGVPAAMPFLELLGHTRGWEAWAESERLASLAGNTLSLVTGTLVLALPVGIVGAVLLYRTDLPLCRLLRFLTVLTLFIPLPLFTSAWQAALGTGGWLPVALWSRFNTTGPGMIQTPTAWSPWAQGLGAAVWVHAVAAVPWVIVLVGQSLCWVERELEEDALTVAGPWRVLWKVTLPRCRATILAAALWVGLLTVTEITVTDMMQVRTFAEEIYTQYVVRDENAVARAVAVSLPLVLLCWVSVVWAALRWERTLPPRERLGSSPLPLPLGRARWPCLLVVLLVAGFLLGIPVASLVWKAGLAGTPRTWSAPVVGYHLRQALRTHGGMLGESLLMAVLAGGLSAAIALVLCWLAADARWFRVGTLGMMAIAWALSGPVIGLGLKSTIARILDLSPPHSLAVALYYGPSPLPAVWAYFIRFFPCAVAIVWLVVRVLPSELRDAARVDGARPSQELRHVIFPLCAPACLQAGMAVAILSLGELGASKIVDTPGSPTFAHQVFTQMHYGVTNDLAALCLLLLALVIFGVASLSVLAGQQGILTVFRSPR